LALLLLLTYTHDAIVRQQGQSCGSGVISAQLTDKELLAQFKQVEKLDKEDKHLIKTFIKTFIDAFITKRQIQQLAK
jgi:ligand-binding sensor protein